MEQQLVCNGNIIFIDKILMHKNGNEHFILN